MADILLQAVFLLFIALIIGYQDPKTLILIKDYQEFGKDLCTKKNTDSLAQCKEQIIEDDKYAGVGRKLCSGKFQNNEKCIKHYLDAIEANSKSKGNLVACMPIATTLDETYPAAVFKIYGKDVIQFINFTQEYKNYLTEHNDQVRLDKVSAISENYKFSPDAIESTFGFIRQDDCFHKPRFISGNSSLSQLEWVQAIRSVSSSFKKSK